MKLKTRLLFVYIVCSTFMYAQEDRLKYDEFSKIADSLFKEKKYQSAAENYSRAFSFFGWKATPQHRYFAGVSNAQSGNMDSAFYHINRLVIRDAFSDTTELVNNESLLPMKTDKRWKPMVQVLKEKQEAREKNYDRPLIAQLNEIIEKDQKYRIQIDSIQNQFGMNSKEMKAHWELITKTDKENLKIIRKILDKRGWLGADIIGREGNSTLFLVIQHSDLKTQQKYLPMMRDAVQKGNAFGSDLALLEDRVALGLGNPQIYGSQLSQTEDGKMFLEAMIDPDNVDKRRASVNLGPIAEYISYFGLTWDLEEYKKQLPGYLEKLKRRKK